MNSMRVCGYPGCGTLVERGHCAKHGGQRTGSPRRNAPRKAMAYVLKRAHGRCESCKRRTKRLAVHHVVPYAEGGSNEPSNLMALCSMCHDKAHTPTP
jgi:5-methylcytosine-specific restriction protein A